jgi:superfamily II DNA or RNA helicase/uncharacterized protein YeaC (DUF1315 family)
MTNLNPFRYYQAEADDAIFEELLTNDKCIVKMFCGTGKSLLMRKCRAITNSNLLVYVFPILALIQQFYTEYLSHIPKDNLLIISSDKADINVKDNKYYVPTTDLYIISQFLSKQTNKIICITYQSFEILVHLLNGTGNKINHCLFDEAHHVVGETYCRHIFETNIFEKQIFFTATPVNNKDVTMYDRNNLDKNKCGKLVYDYSYLRGMNENFLNPFEIRIEFYTENTNKSLYETIARAILETGNNRVLTFHADVNTERDLAVKNFVNNDEFVRVFKNILKKEFPDKLNFYKKVKMIGLYSEIPSNERKKILEKFDTTPNDKVFVICSCKTIGEGIDTKNANMCVFADPKSSFVEIIQNIGRIVRKQLAKSTILIPCWVDREKYLNCNGDRELCDEVIRQDLSKEGNFNGILNVLSALKQEDEDLYDICLYYPDVFSPQEIQSNLERQGYVTAEMIGDGTIGETLDYLLEDVSLDNNEDGDDEDEYECDEDYIMNIADKHNVCVEVHTNSLENPVETYNPDAQDIIRVYKSYDEENDMDIYQPIVEKTGEKRNRKEFARLDKEKRNTIKVHTNPDVKVLWNITNDLDMTKEICSCVIDCEVIEYDPMERAMQIVERAKERERNGLNLLPRSIRNVKNRTTPELEQEHKDALKLGRWKQALKGNGKSRCHPDVKQYLDINLPGWNYELEEKALENAKNIVIRAKERERNGQNLLPRFIRNIKNRNTPELEQEHKDAQKLSDLKKALKGNGKSRCHPDVKQYLDINLPVWNDELDAIALKDSKNIVIRAKERERNGQNLLPRKIQNKLNRHTPELEQEYKDALKLGKWKQALKGKGSCNCYDEVKNYLDINLPGWNDELDLDAKALEDAKNIVIRAKERERNGQNVLPRSIRNVKNRNTPELEQEHKDALKLSNWKTALKGQTRANCSDDVKNYLDINLPGWNDELDLDTIALEFAKNIVMRANERVKKGKNLFPRYIKNKKNRNTPELEQENKDATKLGHWKRALKGQSRAKCFKEVKNYLDINLPGWNGIDDNTSVTTSSLEEDDDEIIKSEKKPKKSMKLQKSKSKNSDLVEETPEQRSTRVYGEMSLLLKQYKTMTSSNLQQLFTQQPQLWHDFHNKSEENEQSYPEESIPRKRVIQELDKVRTKRPINVVDMGCGRAQISAHFNNDARFNFINYDHVACNNTVTVCDIANTPLEEDSVQRCVLSMALWGTNCKAYITEAYRILDSDGKLILVEPTKRWSEKDEQGNIIDDKESSELKKVLVSNGFKIDKEQIDKFSLFICSKLQL